MTEITKQRPIAGNWLDFERPLMELENRIVELKESEEKTADLIRQISRVEALLTARKKRIYSSLTAWQKIQIARHPDRPSMLSFVDLIFDDFIELHGDRCFGDDRALIGGVATIGGQRVVLIGQQKGRDTREKIAHNFGSPHPEGYRKALRLMRLAEKFSIPIISFIDTPGAYPGISAEERGQAQAIAYNLRAMMALRAPIIVIIAGEGCSGGALGIGIGDVVAILEHAYYSVISPEGCAAILWKDSTKMAQAAKTLRLTADDLLKRNLVDYIITEPLGGAHKNHSWMGAALKQHILHYLKDLKNIPLDELLDERYRKFRNHGVYIEKTPGRTESKQIPVSTLPRGGNETRRILFPQSLQKTK